MRQSTAKTILLHIYNRRLVSMMKDYDISLKEAIEWDMSGFQHHYKLSYDSHVAHYLNSNGITDKDSILYYLKVLRGKLPDLKLSDMGIEGDDSSRDSGTQNEMDARRGYSYSHPQ